MFFMFFSILLFFFPNSIFSIIPNWNLTIYGLDLLSSSNQYSYSVSDAYLWYMHVILTKNITKNDNGIITHDNDMNASYGDNYQNYRTFDSVEFENIESFGCNIICPKGSYHPFSIQGNNEKIELKPDNFGGEENWELKCYIHRTGYFLVFYLMKTRFNFYYYKISGNELVNTNWYYINNIPLFYDFKLENLEDAPKNYYHMMAMILENEDIILKNFYFNFDNEPSSLYSNYKNVSLYKAKNYTQGVFLYPTNDFVFITYNSISDFISGYSIQSTADYENMEGIEITINEQTPFEFLNDVEIKEMKFLLYEKYVYYKIYDKDTQKYYHGILDVKSNKIVFNTDEDIDTFIPYSSNSMLAITSNTAYKICVIKDDNDNCISECPSGETLMLDINGNTCKSGIDDCFIYTFIHKNIETICVDDCDINIYTIDSSDSNKCGLCRDINSSYPYKIINSTDCINTIPEGAEIYNNELYLLICKEGYYEENGICVKSCNNEKCSKCNDESNLLNLCITCKEDEGYKKVNYKNSSYFDCMKSNDVNLAKFYFNETLEEYRPCYELCKSCDKEGYETEHNCLECEDGYMLKPWNNPYNICVVKSNYYYIYNDEYYSLNNYPCPSISKFYIKEKKACIDDCSKHNTNIYLFNGDCLENCPSNIEIIIEDNKCKVNKDKCIYQKNNLYIDFNNLGNIVQYIGTIVASYLFEFSYTNNFVSLYESTFASILLFKNISCLDEFNIGNSYQYFINCSNKIIEKKDIKNKEVLFIIVKSILSSELDYYLFNLNMEKLDIQSICEETTIDNDKVQGRNYSEIAANFDGNNFQFTEDNNNNIYSVSYLSNQIKNSSIINLGNCETILRNIYNLTNEEIIIIKAENSISEYNIPIIDYLVFDTKGSQLYLDYCSNTTIEYQIPVDINEDEIYKYDPQSFYYNDKCYPVESKNGVDMTIYDRKNEYNEKNLALCQTDCTFVKYDSENKRALCECSVKNKLPFNDIFKVDKNKLLQSFLNIKEIINIDVIKCYKLIFYGNGLSKNIGSYILLAIILISIITSILLGILEFKKFKNLIENILNNKPKENIINPCIEKENVTKNNIQEKKEEPTLHKIKKKKKKVKNKKKQKIISSDLDLKNSNDEINIFKQKNNNNNINNEELNIYEINNLSYDKALTNDKRTFFQYYLSLIMTKQLLIFSFYLKSDYNLRTIKICLFFLTLALNLTINALFFNDSTMHKIYEDQGSYNFLYQLPQIIYSLLISIIIKTILSLLSLTEKFIVKLKQDKLNNKDNNNNSNINSSEIIIKCLKIKLIIFYVLEIIILLLFWYYISCFCALYKNTQIHLISDTFSSFALSLIYPFALNLIPGLFRINALKQKDTSKNNNGKYLYKVSQILQLI